LLSEALSPFAAKLPGADANHRNPEPRISKATVFHKATSWDGKSYVMRNA
jgi:hypothetical protein